MSRALASPRAAAAAVAAAALALASACAGSGLGKVVRDDIQATMAQARAPLSACYATRLAKNRKLRGTIFVTAQAEPGTGKIIDVKIRHDELGDPDLADCVVAEVSGLTLGKPTKTRVSFEYPIAFAPTK